jgi:hypothetical protein
MERKRGIPVQKELSFIDEVESRFEEDLHKYSHLDPSMCAIKEEEEDEPGLTDRAQFERELLLKMKTAPLPQEEEKGPIFRRDLPSHLNG